MLRSIFVDDYFTLYNRRHVVPVLFFLFRFRDRYVQRCVKRLISTIDLPIHWDRPSIYNPMCDR